MTDPVNGLDASWMEDAHASQEQIRPPCPSRDNEEIRRASLTATFEADAAFVAYRVPDLPGVCLSNRWLQEQINPTRQRPVPISWITTWRRLSTMRFSHWPRPSLKLWPTYSTPSIALPIIRSTTSSALTPGKES